MKPLSFLWADKYGRYFLLTWPYAILWKTSLTRKLNHQRFQQDFWERPNQIFRKHRKYICRCKKSQFGSGILQTISSIIIECKDLVFWCHFSASKTSKVLHIQKTVWVSYLCYHLDIFPPIFQLIFFFIFFHDPPIFDIFTDFDIFPPIFHDLPWFNIFTDEIPRQ